MNLKDIKLSEISQTRMNLSMKQKLTHREQTGGCQGRGGGVGEGRIGSLGLADVNYYI